MNNLLPILLVGVFVISRVLRALFGSLLYCLNKLNSDSELIVLSASGAPPSLLLTPA